MLDSLCLCGRRNLFLDGLVDDFAVGSIALDRSDAILAGGIARIHLALADDLAVRSGQREVGRTVFGDLAVEAGVVLGIFLHRLDAVQAGGFGLVSFAGEDHLTVGGLEVELKFTVFTGGNYEFSHSIENLSGLFVGKLTIFFRIAKKNRRKIRP